MDNSFDISVVIPVYNEEKNVRPLFEELIPVLNTLNAHTEIIVIDDCSEDGTLNSLVAERQNFPNLKIIPLKKRYGKSTALNAGIKTALGKIIITLDGDMQDDPADIPFLLKKLELFDAVCGWRKNRKETCLKISVSKIANRIISYVMDENFHDIGCALKVFKSEPIKSIKLYKGSHRFLPFLLKIDGYEVAEMIVNNRPRLYGKSKYSIFNRFFKIMTDLFVVKWMLKNRLNHDQKISPKR